MSIQTCNSCGFFDGSGWCMKHKISVGVKQACHDYYEPISQQEAIAGEKTTYETALDYLSEMGYGSGTNFTSKGVASLLADFASQQTSAKDKEIAELKEAISELIQAKDWKDKYGKDEHYLKAMPIAWENVRKLIQK